MDANEPPLGNIRKRGEGIYTQKEKRRPRGPTPPRPLHAIRTAPGRRRLDDPLGPRYWGARRRAGEDMWQSGD